MKKIPTAEEFLIKACIDAGFTESYARSVFRIMPDSSNAFINAIIECTKLHVQAALKTANQHATASNKSKFSGDCNPVVDSDSILNAYPLENIK